MEQPDSAADERFAILDVFGLKLEVSNPRLAELLTMDATNALTSDVRDLMVMDRRAVAEAIPDAIVSMPTARSEAEDRERREFRAEVEEHGRSLGFDVSTDGSWSSPTGIEILTRLAERSVTLAAAAHFVTEVGALVRGHDETTSALFVVDGQQSADVFKVAIRQRGLHHSIRTVSVEALREIVALLGAGRLDHRQVVMLLAPIADIDVGEMLSVMHAEESAPTSGGE